MHMEMMKFYGMYALIPTAILLTISFFVLVIVRKVQEQGLKAFGYVIAVLLWISAALVFAKGVYTLSKSCHSMKPMMRQMMKGKMQQPMMEQRDIQPRTTK